MPPPDRPVPDLAATCGATVRAVQDLDPIERAAVVLVYWHGRTQPQVAADLGIPVKVVRRALTRGLRRLAEQVLAGESRLGEAAERTVVSRRRRP
ncbi:RNA polymerase sigma factor [uncultured Jatrophihabitans sp.]|uniref:RNA polymerase sigma factor n=1 Tax=uncultured Jatrophihabitans sp. TaxID=1610747 RepID=UPI0035CADBBC